MVLEVKGIFLPLNQKKRLWAFIFLQRQNKGIQAQECIKAYKITLKGKNEVQEYRMALRIEIIIQANKKSTQKSAK